MAYTPTVSPQVSYNDDMAVSASTTMVRSVVNTFRVMSQSELPFLNLISGGSPESPALNSLSEPCVSNRYEWLEDEDPPFTSAVADNPYSSGATTLNVSSGQGKYFRVGDIILVEDEQMYVSAISTDALTVTPGWASTTQANHILGKPVYIIGRTHLEGGPAPDDITNLLAVPYNFTQEVVTTFKLSDLQQQVQRYGISSAIERETQKQTRLLLRRLERQAIFGRRVAPSSTTPAAMGGLWQYVGTTKDVNAALTKTIFENELVTLFNKVGAANMPDTILCNARGRNYLSNMYGTTGVVTYRDQSNPTGGWVIEMVKTSTTGDLRIYTINDIYDDPTNGVDIFVVKKDMLGFGPLRGMELKREPLARTTTSQQWMISGAYTMEVRNSLSHIRYKRITGWA